MPYNDRLDTMIEIANESTVLLVLSVLLGYTDEQVNPLVGSNIGFLLVGLILFNIFINAILFIFASLKVVFYKFIRPTYNKLKKYCGESKK